MLRMSRVQSPQISQARTGLPPVDAQLTLPQTALTRFIRAQVVNTKQNAAALRPFRLDEFGSAPASPSAAHINAANRLIEDLRRHLLGKADRIAPRGRIHKADMEPSLIRKEMALRWIKQIEKIWDFYLELFGQRMSQFADWLLAADRIGLDCYQVVYTGLGTARSIPSPPPFAYMETGSTPATFRRGVSLTRLGKRANPFPVVELPYHRLVNPWTLGAIHHEVSHNLQSDLGLWREVPRHIYSRLKQAGINGDVSRIWARWHKEIWADLVALLLGGPAVVTSLIDVLARSPATTLRFNAAGVHPTPYLRTFISLELLRRMGFGEKAEELRRLWIRLYPSPARSNIPRQMMSSFPRAHKLVVDTICFQPYRQLGDKSLVQVARFTPDHQQMTQEAARRIAAGVDPGIIPARFLVAAARWALDNKLASPGKITRNFYQALNKR